VPFYKLDSLEPPDVVLKQATATRFQLLRGFRWQKPDGSFYLVTPHDANSPPTDDNSTDLASVPRWLWWFVASYGHHTLPALLHDQAVDDEDVPDRRLADTWFRLSMRDAGVFWLRRWIMWAAVSLETLRQRHGVRFIVFLTHLCGLIAAITLCAIGRVPWWVVAAVVAAGAIWGPRRWLSTLIGGALVIAPSILVLTVWAVEMTFNTAQAVFTGSWPPPGPGPTSRALTAGQQPSDT
jgi:hypothetical protein